MRRFWESSEARDDRPALIVPGGTVITHAELSALADAWKARLTHAAKGTKPLVILDFSTDPDAIAAYIGVLRCEFPLIVSEPGASQNRQQILSQWSPEIHLHSRLEGGIDLKCSAETSAYPLPHADLRLLLSTSGSTGDPKLVRLSAENIDSNAQAIARYLAITEADRAATTLPLFYSYGLSVLNSYLAARASLILTDRSVADPEFFPEMRTAGATSLALVPHQFDLLERSGFTGMELPLLRYITQAGGKLDVSSIRRFARMGENAAWQLFVMYGQTEAAPRIAYVPPEALPGAADTIGHAIPGGRLWITDEDGVEITAADQPGELVYEGPNVMMGYADSRADLARGYDVKELRTGDIAERTPEGFFRITGRLKRFVKLFGLRISLDRIEDLLRENGIACHAVALDDSLILMCRDTAQGPLARQTVAQAYGLPEGAVLSGQLSEVPLLPSGKTDHHALRRLASRALEQAQSDERRRIAQDGIPEIIRRATRSRQVSLDDSFLSLGGDSLSYVEVQIALEERLGYVPEGWERMPLGQMVMLADARTTNDALSSRGMHVGIDVVLRLLAITMIVAQHASDYPLYGGPWVLIAVMGYSFARFQMGQIAGGQAVGFARRMLYPIVPLYMGILALYATFQQDVAVPYWFMTVNYIKLAPGAFLIPYWFVSLYVQIIILLALVIAIPTFRRAIVIAPWRASALLAGASLLVLIATALVAPRSQTEATVLSYYPQRGLVECLGVFALGAMLWLMQGRRQFLVTSALVVATLLAWLRIDMSAYVACILGISLLLLAFSPAILMPKAIGMWISKLATTTLFVYLVHMVVVHVAVHQFDLPDSAAVVASVTGAFTLGVLVKRAFGFFETSALTRIGTSRSQQQQE